MNIDQEFEGISLPLEEARYRAILCEISELRRRVEELEVKAEGDEK